MKRFVTFFAALALLLLVVPLSSAAAAAAGVPGDLVAGFAALLSQPEYAGLVVAPVLPAINLSGVAELFRPERVVQVINTTEAYGTPVLDRFYPNNRRQAWDSVLVPRSKITDITRAVPLVLRGAPGITIGVGSGSFEYLEPQPIKTIDGVSAVEYNNAALAGMASLQQWADGRIAKHLATHRFTTEALAAQSLTGTITFPIADATGSVVDTYTVQFGTVGSYTVTVDWTAGATAISAIYKDLRAMRRAKARQGWNLREVLVGENIMAALLDKIQAIANDMRTAARVDADGTVRIGEFTLQTFDAEYYHPGGVGGTPAAGYTQVVGDDDVLMYDPNAPFTLLRVRLDNFKMATTAPMGVITELSKDGSLIEQFFESKPFPIPVPEAMTRTDATDTTP